MYRSSHHLLLIERKGKATCVDLACYVSPGAPSLLGAPSATTSLKDRTPSIGTSGSTAGALVPSPREGNASVFLAVLVVSSSLERVEWFAPFSPPLLVARQTCSHSTPLSHFPLFPSRIPQRHPRHCWQPVLCWILFVVLPASKLGPQLCLKVSLVRELTWCNYCRRVSREQRKSIIRSQPTFKPKKPVDASRQNSGVDPSSLS